MTQLFEKLVKKFDESEYESVINSWSAASSLPSMDPLCAKLTAAAYFKLAQYSKSLDLLEQIESCFTEDPSFFSLIGVTHRRLGNLRFAEYYLKKSVDLDPKSLPFQNNYANLLIDLKNFDEAKSILDSILLIDKDFRDAQVNLIRLNEAVNKTSLLASDSSSVNHEFCDDWSPADPLLLAFSEGEVERTTSKIRKKQLSDSAQKVIAILPHSESDSTISDQITLAKRSIIERNYKFALQICASIYKSCSPHSFADVFDIAADAYIGLRLFNQAEICFSTVGNLQGYSFKIFFNLATLACIRGDLSLASLYHKRASEFEPENPNLTKLNDNITSLSPSFSFPLEWKCA